MRPVTRWHLQREIAVQRHECTCPLTLGFLSECITIWEESPTLGMGCDCWHYLMLSGSVLREWLPAEEAEKAKKQEPARFQACLDAIRDCWGRGSYDNDDERFLALRNWSPVFEGYLPSCPIDFMHSFSHEVSCLSSFKCALSLGPHSPHALRHYWCSKATIDGCCFSNYSAESGVAFMS